MASGYTFVCFDASFKAYCSLLGVREGGSAAVAPKTAAGGWRGVAASCIAIAEAALRAQVLVWHFFERAFINHKAV